jgi:hypothetical protein
MVIRRAGHSARMRSARSVLLPAAASLALLALGGPLASAADESAKSPKAILADVARDLGPVRSYHLSGTQVDSAGRSSMVGDIDAAGQADLSIRQGKTTVRLLVVSRSATYLKANAAYWKSAAGKNGAAVAAQLADRWVKAPATSVKDFTSLFAQLAPKRLASCVAVGTGTLAKGGTTTVDGHRVVVIIDRGDKPGTTPGKLYVSTTGRKLPVRVVQTGGRRAGGHLDSRCQDADDDSTAQDLHLSAFDKPVHVTAPKGAIVLPADGTPPGGTSI